MDAGKDRNISKNPGDRMTPENSTDQWYAVKTSIRFT